MRYYFGQPQIPRLRDYIVLSNQLLDKDVLPDPLQKEYNFFILESCRFYIDGMDLEELLEYYELVRSANSNLLIHKDKIESYFKKYVNDLFNFKRKDLSQKPPANVSQTLIDIMLSELDIMNIMQHVNVDTQEINLQSIKDTVKLEKINAVKRLHDRVLFFIEYYNKHVKG